MFRNDRMIIYLDMYMPRDQNCISSLNSKTTPKLDILHRLTNHNLIRTALQNPSLRHNVPHAHVPAVELKRHFSLLARLQELLLETA
jgi:hypothetical protein